MHIVIVIALFLGFDGSITYSVSQVPDTLEVCRVSAAAARIEMMKQNRDKIADMKVWCEEADLGAGV